MPHSVRDGTGASDPHRRDDQGSPALAAAGEDATREQSPMLRAWSDELDPKNLTISEALFFGGLTDNRAEVGDARGSQDVSGAQP